MSRNVNVPNVNLPNVPGNVDVPNVNLPNVPGNLNVPNVNLPNVPGNVNVPNVNLPNVPGNVNVPNVTRPRQHRLLPDLGIPDLKVPNDIVDIVPNFNPPNIDVPKWVTVAAVPGAEGRVAVAAWSSVARAASTTAAPDPAHGDSHNGLTAQPSKVAPDSA